MNWQPDSWRTFPILQVPEYPDQGVLNKVEQKLAEKPPLVFAGEVQNLRSQLGHVANGQGIFASGRRLCREFC